MRRFLQKHRNDILLIGALLIAAAVLFIGFRLAGKPGRAVLVTENGREIARFSLAEDRTYPIPSEKGENLLRIENGAAWIESADCRDQICVKRGKIRKAGETIVCLPHRIVVTVTEEAP